MTMSSFLWFSSQNLLLQQVTKVFIESYQAFVKAKKKKKKKGNGRE